MPVDPQSETDRTLELPADRPSAPSGGSAETPVGAVPATVMSAGARYRGRAKVRLQGWLMGLVANVKRMVRLLFTAVAERTVRAEALPATG